MNGDNKKRKLVGVCKSEGEHRVMDNYDTKEVGSMKKEVRKMGKRTLVLVVLLGIAFGCGYIGEYKAEVMDK
jgi:hypothetical protein